MSGLVIGAMLFAYGAMLALCQGLERHFKQVWGRPCLLWQRLALRGMGWAALLVSLLLCAQAWGWAMGPVAWLGLLSLSGLALVMLLPYWPRSATALGLAAPLWAVVRLLG